MKFNFSGLRDSEVLESRLKYGSNELSPAKTESFWDKLRENFKDPIIIILSIALVIMIVLSILELTEWYEALAIAIAVALATLVATYSEFKNESSFQKLQEEASLINNNAFRNGRVIPVKVTEIVTGDYVLLQAGDKVPADGYLVKGDLKINQASLTGESEAVNKFPNTDDNEIDPTDLTSEYRLFRGSVVEDGEAVMIVEVVGDKTFYGNLAQELSDADDRPSPLQIKLKGLANMISRFGYIAALLILVTFFLNKAIVANNFDAALISEYFSDLEMVVTDFMDALVLSIIIVVAAVPEGLPMMIAIVLSLNMRKMLKEKVLVRRLLGIETAGSLNILYSDKTGTLTKGELEARLFISGENDSLKNYFEIPEALRKVVRFTLEENSSAFITAHGEIVGGNVSERALMAFLDLKIVEKQPEIEFDEEVKVLFNSERKFSATQLKSDSELLRTGTNRLVLIKGAPEVIMDKCDRYFTYEGTIEKFTKKDEISNKTDVLANSGIRLIALAVSDSPIGEDKSLPDKSIFVGVIGLRDEIRDESLPAVMEVQGAGVQVVMITGDKKGTAESIAKEVGVIHDDHDKVLVSADLSKMSDEEIREALPDIKVISRALPTDKSRLVRISKRMGLVAGMTGDGVNDSAALKQADVGFAMGSGSEVSKEAGDIVIMDDNFNSISNAIRYGRTIFKSIRKFIIFQLTVNVAAVSTAFFGPLLGVDFPLTIIQILWINIIMDSLAAIAFGGEPALHRYMKEKPISREANILSKYMRSQVLTSGIFITVFSLFFLLDPYFKTLFIRDGVPDNDVFLSAFFNLFIFMILFNGFSVRTESFNLFEHLSENKSFWRVFAGIFVLQIVFTYIGGNILRTRPLLVEEWALVIGLSLIIIPVDMMRKFIYKLTNRSEEHAI